MASLDSLPADQRAVLQLVLENGRSYDEIAQMLNIDRAAVRARALAAFDALGPQTGVDSPRRALITDYLLGQLPPPIEADTRERLASNPAERAWARVLASELAPIAREPLPEIPVDAERVRPLAAPGPAIDVPAPVPLTAAEPGATAEASTPTGGGERSPRVSRLGGLVLIAGAVLAALVVVFILLNSGGTKHIAPPSSSVSSSSAAASVSSTTTATSSATPKIVAQINLKPARSKSKAAGVAEVLKEGTSDGIEILAQNIAPNTSKPANAYAVWLYNSASDARLLGFVNPGVGKNGRLSTAGGLPTNATHYKQLIVTLETKADPKTPGTIVLAGALTGLS